MCGGTSYGNERLMAEYEGRGQKYLFRKRSAQEVKQPVMLLERQGGWQPLMEGWQGGRDDLHHVK